MDPEKLKHLNDADEITDALHRAKSFGGDIWQSTKDGRKIVQIYHSDVEPSGGMIIKASGLGDLDHRSPVFIRLCYRNIIFKLQPGQFTISENVLRCLLPKEARALETRMSERYVLPFNSEISLSIIKVAKSFTENTHELEVRIVDVSEYGFGILISAANREYFRRHDHFWIKSVDQCPLRKELFGSVSYVAPKGYYLKRGEVRVGLCLDTALEKRLFDQLKARCKLVLGA